MGNGVRNEATNRSEWHRKHQRHKSYKSHEERSRSAGFSLVELMIVLAIIAITAAYAVPAYQDYIARSRVGEGMSLASTARMTVLENATLGLPFDTTHERVPATANVMGLAVDRQSGQITISYTARVASPDKNTLVLVPSSLQPDGKRLALTVGQPPDGILQWTCFAAGKVTRSRVGKEAEPAEDGPAPTVDATLPARLAMASCR